MDKISSMGNRFQNDIKLERIIRLTNLFSCNLAVMTLVMALIGMVSGISDSFLTVARLILVPIYAVPLLLNRFQQVLWARRFLIWVPPTLLLAIAYVAGIESPIVLRIAMIPLLLTPVILYGIDRVRGMVLGIIWIAFTSSVMDKVIAAGGLISGLPAELFSNEPEIILNWLITIILIVGAFLCYQVLLLRSEKELHKERQLADSLLENILPEEIIPILKQSPSVIADHFDNTSILFADIVGFTSKASEMNPNELVEMLNSTFSYFDSLVEKYGLEKIKTIGDCYMAAAGVPKKRDDHAEALVSMAMEAQEYFHTHQFGNQTLKLRMGISSGSVIAGVIGRKKFIYDLWGDTVNTASRMESYGQIGFVQITEVTRELIADTFETRKMGDVDVKGKGVIPIYQVVGPKESAS